MWKKAIKLSLIALLVAPCALQAKMIEDVAGNKIEIADNVQRIADLWNANNQIVLLLGGMDKVGRLPIIFTIILGLRKFILKSKQ